jgi:hypothetical protein
VLNIVSWRDTTVRPLIIVPIVKLPVSSVQFKSKPVLECRKLLISLAETKSLTLTLVPGHTDVQGNVKTRLRLLAKVQQGFCVGPEPVLPFTFKAFKVASKKIFNLNK